MNRETRKHYKVVIVHKTHIDIIFGHYKKGYHAAKELLWVSTRDPKPEAAEQALGVYNDILKANGPCDLQKRAS